MKAKFTIKSIILLTSIFLGVNQYVSAQDFEWRLGNSTYSSVDPDAAGPATGSVTFTLQVHTVSVSIPTVTALTLGYSYQPALAMLPTTTGCTSTITPTNTVISPEFTTAGFVYETVNQCNVIGSEITGGQNFTRKTAGSLLSGPGLTITTAWSDVFTVTLWTLGNSYPQGGYVMINSGFGGTPAGIGSYGISDLAANDSYIVNSLTYTTPLPLGGTLPVLFSKFEAKCTNTGTLISWATAQEGNSSRFEIERSSNGTVWTNIGTVAAAGNSSSSRNYQQVDLNGGIAFYRIKQIDKDGQFIYTGVEKTNCLVKNITSLIYPVPAYDVLNVVIKSDRSIRTQLMVYDMQGKLVKNIDAPVIAGNNAFKINLIGLASGDYMLRSNDATIEINKIFTIKR